MFAAFGGLTHSRTISTAGQASGIFDFSEFREPRSLIIFGHPTDESKLENSQLGVKNNTKKLGHLRIEINKNKYLHRVEISETKSEPRGFPEILFRLEAAGFRIQIPSLPISPRGSD